MKNYFTYIVCVAALLLSSCSKPKPPLNTKQPLVIVSVSPYETFVQRIAQDTVIVKAAVPANFNSHLFEATPKQIEGFEHASVFLGIGEPFEKNLLQALQSYNKNILAVDLGHLHGLRSYKETSHGSCSHQHGDHSHEGIDKHFWSSPKLALEQSRLILKSLVKAFPEHQQLYETNFKSLETDFNVLMKDLSAQLNSSKGKAIIISHPSLGYFCQDYGLVQLALECEGKTPLPEDLTKTLSFSKTHPVLCVFGLEQFDNRGALALSQHLKLPLYIININAPEYFSNFRHIAKLIAENNHE